MSFLLYTQRERERETTKQKMGSVFGKETVAEPSYEVLLERNHHVHTSYEIRRYGERFAATCAYPADSEDTSTPFRALAGYIGVFGKPQNEGHKTFHS